jgi:hypothetical protein
MSVATNKDEAGTKSTETGGGLKANSAGCTSNNAGLALHLFFIPIFLALIAIAPDCVVADGFASH